MNNFDPNSSDRRSSVAIIGVGNGGGNVISTIASEWPDSPGMVVVNTDQGVQSKQGKINFIHIGHKILKGLGTGGDPRVARQAAESDIEQLRALFNGVALAIFAVGLGGGTGTGVTPVLIEEAKKAGAMTLCFVMLPFEFEGMRRQENAEQGLQAIRDMADGVICLPSQRLVALVEDKANIKEAFHRAEVMLALGIRELLRVLSRSSALNFAFSDLRAFLQNSGGSCIFCFSEGSGPQKTDMALENIKKHVLLNNCQTLAETDAFVVCIVGGPDLSVGEVDRLVREITSFGRKEAHAMTGVGCEPEWREKICVTILATEKRQPAKKTSAQKEKPLEEPSRPGVPINTEKAKTGMVQKGLFDNRDESRFKDVSPTIVDGNNLDTPTFLRRRITVQKANISNI